MGTDLACCPVEALVSIDRSSFEVLFDAYHAVLTLDDTQEMKVVLDDIPPLGHPGLSELTIAQSSLSPNAFYIEGIPPGFWQISLSEIPSLITAIKDGQRRVTQLNMAITAFQRQVGDHPAVTGDLSDSSYHTAVSHLSELESVAEPNDQEQAPALALADPPKSNPYRSGGQKRTSSLRFCNTVRDLLTRGSNGQEARGSEKGELISISSTKPLRLDLKDKTSDALETGAVDAPQLQSPVTSTPAKAGRAVQFADPELSTIEELQPSQKSSSPDQGRSLSPASDDEKGCLSMCTRSTEKK